MRILAEHWWFWVFCLFGATSAHGAGSVMSWPLDPTIEAWQVAGAVWIEYVGSSPVHVQTRVFAGSQSSQMDAYAPQDALVATPPLAVVPPGRKQLVRLTLTAPVAQGKEHAYRIVIDELPAPRSTEELQSGPSAALKFQMRYSLPLFVYGEGVWGKHGSSRRRTASAPAAPHLSWTVLEADGQRHLELRNDGNGHARLSAVRLVSESGSSVDIARGLLGYVLAGERMRWPLPEQVVVGNGDRLEAQLQANAAPTALPRN